MINWKCNETDLMKISAIVDRALEVGKLDPERHKCNLLMDLQACHNNGCKLNLDAMINADDTDLIHDVFGINRHLNRDNGQLEDCFLPRFALV